jgi:competence protein ComEC
MNDNIFFRPFIPLLIAFICGILLGSASVGFEIWVVTVVIVCAGFCLLQIWRLKCAFNVPFLLFVALGYLAIQPWIFPRYPANHIIHYADTQRWDIVGHISTRPRQNNNRFRFDVRVASLHRNHQSLVVTGKLRVTVIGDVPNLAAGDMIRFTSHIRAINNFKNPGGFDYKRYLALKGIWASAYVKADKLSILEKVPPGSPFGILNQARDSFGKSIEKSGDNQAHGVLKALIIGDRSQITEETRQVFHRTGAGHLLAISGLHIGIVASVAFFLFHWLMLRIKTLLRRAWTRKAAALLSLIPVFIYGMVAGFSPSTQRAVIMVAIVLMTFLFEREQDPVNTLSLAALVILVLDPPSLFSISFQLSFTAVFSIIYGLSRVQNRVLELKPQPKNNWRTGMAKKLFAFFLVSFFAICGTLPLVAFYFNQISVVGLVANFLAVPLVGFITVPLGLTALFISPFSLTLASWFIAAASKILFFVLEILDFMASLPFAAVKTITPSLLEIGCIYILGWALLDIYGDQSNPTGELCGDNGLKVNANSSEPNVSRFILSGGRCKPLRKVLQLFACKGFKQKVPAKMAIILVLVTLLADTSYWLYQRFWHPNLRITVIDVGQGSASLLELPGGQTILIDGGGFSDNSAFDVGEKIIAPFLWRNKIRTVDTLILSHPNSDHLNGLIYIAKYFNVKRVWSNNEKRKTIGYHNFTKVVANRNITLPVYANMFHEHCINGVNLIFLYPPHDFLNKRDKEKWRNTNNNSLVVQASFGNMSFLFPGDIMAAAEKELVRLAGDQLASTVLIAPHHGSRSSSSEIFLDQVRPEVVIVSSGRNRRLKFPHPTVLRRYENRGYNIFRTNINGAICLTTDGRHLFISSQDEF